MFFSVTGFEDPGKVSARFVEVVAINSWNVARSARERNLIGLALRYSRDAHQKNKVEERIARVMWWKNKERKWRGEISADGREPRWAPERISTGVTSRRQWRSIRARIDPSSTRKQGRGPKRTCRSRQAQQVVTTASTARCVRFYFFSVLVLLPFLFSGSPCDAMFVRLHTRTTKRNLNLK